MCHSIDPGMPKPQTNTKPETALELELRQTKEQLQIAEKVAQAGSWTWEIATNKVQWSENLCYLHGIQLADFDGTFDTAIGFIHPDDIGEIRQKIETVLSEQITIEAEYRIVTANKATKRLKAIFNFICDDSDNIIALTGISQDITEKIQSAESLHTSEERFRMIFENAPIGITFFDSNGVVTACNEHLAQIIGAPREALIGLNMLTTFKNESQKIALQQALSGTISHYEGEYTTVISKKNMNIKTIYAPILSHDGLAGAVGIVEEITERKQAEEKLNAVVSLLTATLESTADGVLAVGFDRRITRFNQRFVDMWGIPAEVVQSYDDNQAIGYVLDKLKDPDAFVARVEALYATPEKESLDLIALKDGRVFERYSRPQWVDGHIKGRVWNFRDKTERQRMERALRKSEDQLRLAMEAAQMGIYDWDMPHNQISWSHRHEVLWGLQPGEFDGTYKMFSERIHPDDLPALNTDIMHCMTEHLPFMREYRVIWPDGTLHWIMARGEFIYNSQGQAVRMIGTVIEITDSKLTESQLKQAVADAESANAAKSRFLMTMGHEIRTPLHGVLGTLQLLRLTELDSEQRNLIEIAHRSGEELLVLLNDLLDFAKLEANKVELEHLDFHFYELLQEVVSLYQPQAVTKDLELTLTIDSHVPISLCGDPTRLRQILNNLISNAIKFTEQGYVHIHSRWVGGEIPGPSSGMLYISIADTGIGISVEQQAVIFDPFIQADSSITRKYGGTGLGLAICKRLITEMGGQLDVSSAFNKGSTFYFSIPLGVTTAKELSSPPSHGFSGPLPHVAHILVVEDNEINQHLAVHMLQKMGLQAGVATNGEQALACLAAQPYDLVLMDMMMPIMDGMDATRKLRASTLPHRNIPVIALTANTSEIDREACLAAGMNDFLIKPVLFSAFEHMLHKWLAK